MTFGAGLWERLDESIALFIAGGYEDTLLSPCYKYETLPQPPLYEKGKEKGVILFKHIGQASDI